MSLTPPDPAVGLALCAAIRQQIEKLGLTIGDEPDWSAVVFEDKQDPFSGETSVLAIWRGQARFGTATFFPDGRIFAEYQVLLTNPADPETYVESVQIWGRPEKFRGEPVIAPYLR